MRTMSPNLPFHLYVNQLKQKYPSFHRCQNVLKQNSVFYRCNTCCLTPGGCLCENCFRNGNHEVGVCLSPHAQGHDVSMEYCYATGVCDCGDENVIRESGWCQLHRSTKNTPLPTEMDAAYSVMVCPFSSFRSYIRHTAPSACVNRRGTFSPGIR